MSDNIDIPVTVSGGAGIDQITTSVDRLAESMLSLGSVSPALDRLNESMATMQGGMTTALTALTTQMQEMKQVLATGFADLSATSTKMLEGMGTSQARAIKDGGDKAVEATEETSMKLLMAIERRIDRQIAADNTLSQAREGMLEGSREREIALQVAFDRAAAAAVEKAAAEHQAIVEKRDLDEYRSRSAASAELQALIEKRDLEEHRIRSAASTELQALIEKRDVEEYRIRSDASAQLQALIEKRDVEEYRTRSASAAELQALIEKRDLEEYRARSEASAQLQALIEKRDTEEHQIRSANAAQLQALVEKRDLDEYRIRSEASAQLRALIERRDLEEYRMRSDAAAQLQALIEKRDMEEFQARSAAVQRILDIEQRRDVELYNMRSSAANQLAEIQQRRDMEEYTAAQTQAQRIIDIEQRRDMELHNMRSAAAASAAAAAERDAVKNVSYRMASPAAQAQTQVRAILAADEGLNPAELVGSKAAADAASKSLKELYTIIEAGRVPTKAAAVDNKALATSFIELDGVLKQAEGAFRGAAHEAGIYGLAHGQLIALLAGGAVAAGLHHIAETGAEVEFQLASLNALASTGMQQPIDFDKFIGITSGTMTRLKDAAEGVHALAQAGMTQGEAFAVLPDIMRLASVGEMTVGQSAEMAVESMHAFGKSIYDLHDIGDILIAVGSKANVSVHKLAEDMKSAAVTGQLFNLDMKEITATVGALAERGLTIQPLSSALNKLYEPSAKTAKVMKEWHLDVKDGAGNLKIYSDFMGELAKKVNEFRVPADALKALGMAPQSIKAMEVMTGDFGGYKHLLEEAEHAHDKAFNAMLEKEDTAKGSWERLASTVDGTFTKSFKEAEPIIRSVEQALMGIAGSKETTDALGNLAAGVARLTETFIGNIGTLVKMAAAYGGMRILGSLTTMLNEYLIAKRAANVLSVESAVVVQAEAVQLELFATAENAAAAGATRLGTAAEVAAGGMRMMTMALGWVMVGITAATVAVDLLMGKMDENEKKKREQQNTYNTTVDAIQREIDRLKALEDQLDLTGETGIKSAAKVQLAFTQMKVAQAQSNLEAVEASSVSDTSLRRAARRAPGSKDGNQLHDEEVTNARKTLEDAKAEAAKASNMLAELDSRQEAVKNKTSMSELKKKIEKLPHEDIKPFENTPAARAAAEAANTALHALNAQGVTLENLTEKTKQYEEAEKAVAATKRTISAAAAGDKDAARVRIEQLQEELRLAQERYKLNVDDLKSQNKRGELGDLQLINKELSEKIKLDTVARDMARAELAAAGPLKPDQRQKYQSKIDSAQARLGKDGLDAQDAERKRLDVLDKMDTEELQARAKALTSKGQLEDAYNLNWEAKNGKLMANLADDIAAAENSQYKDRLERFKAFLEDQRRLGANDARFKEAKNDFGAASAELNQRLNYLKLQNGPGTGLSSQMRNMGEQQDTYGEMLPKMQAAQNRVQSLSSVMYSGPDAKEKLKEAKTELQDIQTQMAAMRNTAVSMADAIAKALTDAFGKGGTAIGGMIVAATAYDTKMKEIDATLKASKGTDADKQKAVADTAAAQIKGYGDMAGAAKGFFDQNSNGYKIMATAEKAFRAIELADAIAVTMKKISLKGTEVGVTVAGDAAKTASGGAASLASMASAAMEATAWGIAAVARALNGPFPMNLVAGAATMAALVAIGVKLTGGSGGGQSAADRQAENGTGTIMGDPKAKSDSIAKSLALVEKNTYNGLSVSQDMLSALQSINSNISGFAGLILQNTNISNPNVNLSSGIGKTGWAQADMAATGAEVGMLFGAPMIGAAIGYIASKIPAVQKLYTSIFGGKQSLDDTGFTVGRTSLGDIASRGANVQTYADITTSGGWFRSDKHSTQMDSAGAEADRQISQILLGMGNAIKSAGAILGLSGSDFDAKLNGFVVDIGKISLKGLSSADQQKAIESAFSKVGDQMATSAFSTITEFSKAGEGALETLTRVATDYQSVDAVFKSFGTAFAEVGVSSIAAREKLINLAGGLDKFTSQAEFFFKNFLTQAQQTAANRNVIQPTLDKYGLSTVGPDAVKHFADVTIAFGAMGSAGAEAYSELMRIAPAFKTVTDVAKGLQDQIDSLLMSQVQKDAAARAALDPVNQVLFDQLQQAKAVSAARSTLASSYQSEAQALQSSVDKLKSFSVSLRNFLNTLQLSDMSPLNPADKYGAALSQFNTVLAKAQNGDADAQANLQSVAQSFLQASKAANASNSTYQSDYQRVTGAVDKMATKAAGQATEGQTNLAALRQQIIQLTTLNETSMSIVEAINNLAVSMTNGKDAKTNATSIEALYQELLGRTADAGGSAYWNQLLQQGVSLSTIIQDIKGSAEYITRMGQVPVTTSVTPSTQYGTAPVAASPTSTANTSTGNAKLDVAQLYWQLFNRAPDSAGLDYWTGVANNGASMGNIKSSMMVAPEYQAAHPTMPATPVTQDPYMAIADQNAKVVTQLIAVTDQLSQLRTEQQQQADNQVSATLTAAASTGEDVAGALKDSAQSAKWNSTNQMQLR